MLDSIAFTIDEYLAPEVTSEIAQSMVLTIRYLLHQTVARVEHEGEVLWEQALDLRRTLAEVVGSSAHSATEMRTPWPRR